MATGRPDRPLPTTPIKRMEWLVSLAQLIADLHVLSVRVSGQLAEGRSTGTHLALVGAPYAFETLFCCWFVLTFCMGIRAQREYMRPKPPPKPSSDSLDRILLPTGEELWRAHDFWKRPIPGKWVGPPPSPKKEEPAQVELPVEMNPEPTPEKIPPRIVVGGKLWKGG